MFWKRELLKEISEVKGELKRFHGMLVIYDLTVQRQEKVIKELLDRLQAKSYPEYKTYEEPEKAEFEDRADFYRPLEDEDLAGEVVSLDGESDRDTER